MDFYRYPYEYGQSEELTKQMFTHQALSSGLPYHRPNQEAHAMPVPSGAPWNVQGVPWGMTLPPQLVQFTAQPPPLPLETKVPTVLHCKRKSLDVDPVIPAKQLITDEKMAAHLSGLHISSEYTAHSSASQPEENMDVGMETFMSISEKLKGHKIVLSEELKKIQEGPLLPAALIDSMEKPHMSLVVWKPRENILEKIKEVKETEEDETKKRIGVLVSELSGMEIEMS